MIEPSSTFRRSVTVVGIAALLSACSTAPRVDMRRASAEREAETLSASLAPVPERNSPGSSSEPHVLIDPPPVTESDDAQTLVDVRDDEEEVEQVLDAMALRTKSTAAPDAEQVLQEADEDDLVRELEARVLRAWQVVSKSPRTEGLDAEHAELRRQAAMRLLAFTFLRAGSPSQELPGDSLRLAASTIAGATDAATAPAQYRLLAAAHLARSGGAPQQVAALLPQELVASVATAEPPTPTTRSVRPRQEAAGAEDAFRVVRMTFARAIEGPGEFCTLPSREVKPGKTVYIYGEFENFAVKKPQEGKPGTQLCAFSASFELLDSEAAVVEELEFLSAKHGRQQVATSAETVNFWARYRVPHGLDPGRYRLRILAQDRIAETDAISELTFTVEG